MLPAFTTIQLPDTTMQRFQQNVAAAFRRLIGSSGNALLDGQRIKNVVLQSGDNAIPHRLERTPEGWLITRVLMAATVHEVASTGLFLTLHASAPTTIDLYVF